jgi:hypothetical protein
MRGLVAAVVCVTVLLSLMAGSALANPRAIQYDNPAVVEPPVVKPVEPPAVKPVEPPVLTPPVAKPPATTTTKPAAKKTTTKPKPKVAGATAVSKTAAPKAPAPATTSGALPFTGFDVALIVGLGGALVAGGLILRAAGRKRDDAV